ncbi:MAG: hypothetical protein ACYS0I_16795 [Planctomycetota bacterium]|jgi:hypothetical protein
MKDSAPGCMTPLAENTTKEGKRQGKKQGSGVRGQFRCTLKAIFLYLSVECSLADAEVRWLATDGTGDNG